MAFPNLEIVLKRDTEKTEFIILNGVIRRPVRITLKQEDRVFASILLTSRCNTLDVQHIGRVFGPCFV
jgi:hypothetical protein